MFRQKFVIEIGKIISSRRLFINPLHEVEQQIIKFDLFVEPPVVCARLIES